MKGLGSNPCHTKAVNNGILTTSLCSTVLKELCHSPKQAQVNLVERNLYDEDCTIQRAGCKLLYGIKTESGLLKVISSGIGNFYNNKLYLSIEFA